MHYERPVLGKSPSVQVKAVVGNRMLTLPKFDYPITPKENFYRALCRKDPVWVPFPPLEMQELHMVHLADKGPEGYQLGPIIGDPRPRYTYLDPFGGNWTYDGAAGGACMTPGTRVCDDILKWEEQIKWPDLHEWNLEERAQRFMKEEYDPTKPLNIDLLHGPFQSLSDYLGGFGEALEAMALEPEACLALFNRFADWMIWLMDKLFALYPVDMVTVHDDWGTEKDTFFSPAMMRAQLFGPTKRIIDHAHARGKLYQFHCCGKVERFMDAFCELGADSLQLQRRVNDLPAYKKRYGDRVSFNSTLDGYVTGQTKSEDEIRRIVQENVNLYAANGGYFPATYNLDSEMLWPIVAELYCFSREYYE